MRFLLKHKLSLLLIFAFFIRLIHLDQSLWLDEATTATSVKTHSYLSLITQFAPSDFHPPLYYFFIKFWTGLFGYSEIALRLPSVIFSLLTGIIIFKSCQTLFRDHPKKDAISFWATALYLVNPLVIYYSQEARMYAIVSLTIATSFYYFLKILFLQEDKRPSWDEFKLIFFTIISFFTFYASVFFIASLFIYFLFAKRYRSFFVSLFSFGVSVFVISPLLLTQYANAGTALREVTNWSLVLGNVTMKNLLLIPLKFTSGRISFEPKILYYALSGGWVFFLSAVVGFGIWAGGRRKYDKKIVLLLYFISTPLLMGMMFSFFSPLLQYFRFSYLLVPLSILVAYSGVMIPHFSLRWEPSPIRSRGIPSRSKWISWTPQFIFFGFLVWSVLYLFFPVFHREDWKGLARDTSGRVNEVYIIPSSADPIRYYAPEIRINSLKALSRDTLSPEIFVIPYTADIHGVAYQNSLQDMGYVKVDVRGFRGLMFEVWKKSS